MSFGAAQQSQSISQAIGEVSADDIRRMNNQMAASAQMDQRAAILNYMWVKAAAEDWHAVADAAMDLREIDAKLSVLRA